MRIAALYDIHGNPFALEAVLREVRDERVDLVVVGGDVLPGPMPQEVMDQLLSLDLPVRFIHGNGDRVVSTHLAGGDVSAEVPGVYLSVIDWTGRQLTSAQRAAIASWPPTCTLEVAGVGRTLFCHATPRNDTECFTRVTAEQKLASIFGNVDAAAVVCGHTHAQFDRTVAGRRVVNAGSVGMPFQQPAAAYWLLLGPDITLRRTDYDVEAAAHAFRKTTYPEVETFAVRYLLNPPSEDETIEMFAKAELSL
jgi:putative phosphoesterase